jgi:predicted AAA+ superfamily ATPase
MKYYQRELSKVCLSDLKHFPVLTVTGPRQSGKSTLLKHILKDWDYVNLEEPDTLDFATEDPQGFLNAHPKQAIFDEIQRAPKLLSQIQVNIDKSRKPGLYAVTGSHNLLLLQNVSQSLAGRTTVRHLLPFSLLEAEKTQSIPPVLEEALFFGGYPCVLQSKTASNAWLDSYLQTYVERDVRLIRNVSDLSTFRRFLKLCAGRAGQLLDLSSLGGDCGITHNTARDWIGVLEAGFIAFRLEPYYHNFSKRIIKSPKLYFYDTGLLCRLLGVQTMKDLSQHPFRGSIFENWCVLEALKIFINRGESPKVYFWRDQKIEVDLLIELSNGKLAALECKSSFTPATDFLDAPLKFRSFAKKPGIIPGAIYGGDKNQYRSEGVLLSWRRFLDEI